MSANRSEYLPIKPGECPNSPHHVHMVAKGATHVMCVFAPWWQGRAFPHIPLSESVMTGARFTLGSTSVDGRSVAHFFSRLGK
jgi:hypothetical protein